MNRKEANQDELIFIKGVGYFHPDLLGIKMGDTGQCVEDDTNVARKPSDRCGCGGRAILTDYTVEGALKQYSVACETCFMGLPYGFDTPGDAWAAWRRAMGGPRTDPITGLAPCGCGTIAKVRKSQAPYSGYYIVCQNINCICNVGFDRDTSGVPLGYFKTEEEAIKAWNTAMGYTSPPRPGAIGPETGEMAPNGDEGATHE